MLYSPIRKNRQFAVDLKYSDVNWSSFSDILDAFEKRIDQWYLEPVRLLQSQPGQHGAFAALALNSLMIDCMCQFEGGKVVSNRTLYTDFIRRRLPHYGRTFSPTILFPEPDSINLRYKTTATGAIKTRQLASVADVLYYVFRCGILHSAHAPLVGVISGLSHRRYSVRKKSLAKYGIIGTSGADCPVIVLDPWKLFEDIQSAFGNYLSRLRTANRTSVLRRRFNIKFEDCFGVPIASAT